MDDLEQEILTLKEKKQWVSVRYTRFLGSQYRHTKYMNSVLSFDFEKSVEFDNGIWFANKRLLSASAIIKPITELRYYHFPKFVMEQKREIGKNLMENLKYWYDNAIDYDEVPFISAIDRKKFLAVIMWCIKSNVRIKAIEKFIHNGDYCGYIDMVIETDFRNEKGQVKQRKYIGFVEIKCRDNPIPRDTDWIQMYVYSKMLGNCRGTLLIVDKHNKIHTFTYDAKRDCSHFKHWMKIYKKYFGVDIFVPVERIYV